MRLRLIWTKTGSGLLGKLGSVLAWGGLLLPASLIAASVTASLDRDTVSLGDAATLTLTCEGGSPKNPPPVPALPGLRTTYQGQSSQFSWVNGESKSTVTYTYQLTPSQPGDFNMPPIEVRIGNETFHTPPFVLKAVRNDTAVPDAANADQQIALLKLITPSQPVFLGQTFPIELDLYVRDNVVNIQNFQSSPFNAEGFTFNTKSVQGQRRTVRIGRSVFQVIPFITTATPVKTGTLAINPVDCTMVLELPGQQRQRDMFDPFGMFNRNEARRVTISSEASQIEVLPLPENAPTDFAGAVGNYTLAMTAAPTRVAAGDPVTVKVQISGRGAIDTLALPAQSTWTDFKVYPATSKTEVADQLGLQGAKNFEIVVVPQSPEVRELPPLSFTYFDPDQKAYRTLTQPAIALSVTNSPAGNKTLLATAPARPEAEASQQDIVPIKQRLGSPSPAGPVLIQRPAFWLVQTAPVVAWMTLLVRRRRAEALANNPRLRRQRAVAALIAAGLEDLRRLAAEQDSDEFFATLFHLFQERLGERLDLPASSITESVVEEHLRPLRVPEPTLNRLQDLFQACNQARYAPVKSSQELKAFIPRLEAALRELQEVGA